MRLKDDTSGKNLDLVEIGLDIVEWESDRKEFGQDVDRVTIVSDDEGICDVIVYDGNDGIRGTSMTKDLKNCSPSSEETAALTLKMVQQTPLVGFHGRVDEYGIVALGLVLFDSVSEECK